MKAGSYFKYFEGKINIKKLGQEKFGLYQNHQ